MSVRLTKKKKKQMLFELDMIITHHRFSICQQLTDRVDRATEQAVGNLLGEMRSEMTTRMAIHFDELLTDEPPVLPFNLSDNDL